MRLSATHGLGAPGRRPIDTHPPRSYTAPMDNTLPSTAHTPTKWNDRLALDVAMTLEKSGGTLQEVLEEHHITADDLLAYRQDPLFLKRVEYYRVEIRDHGLTFKLKARMQAEELLATSFHLIHDPAVSPSVKADLIKSTVKWAGYEPKNEPVVEQATNGVSITINLGSSPEDIRTVTAVTKEPVDEPTTIDFDD